MHGFEFILMRRQRSPTSFSISCFSLTRGTYGLNACAVARVVVVPLSLCGIQKITGTNMRASYEAGHHDQASLKQQPSESFMAMR